MQTNLSLILAFDSPEWLGLTIRFCVAVSFVASAFVLRSYWRKRTVQREPTNMTKSAALRSMRILHAILCIAIVMYAYVAETILRPTSVAPALFVEAFSVLCVAMVVVGLAFRRRLLPSAIEGMRRGDAKSLAKWQQANVLSMVLAEAVSLYGFALRAIGGSQPVMWAFFMAAVILMWAWRPQLTDDTAPIQN